MNEIVITLGDKDKIYSGTNKYQYDYGQTIRVIGNLPEDTIAEITNGISEPAEAVQIESNLIRIPDKFFATGKNITVYLTRLNGSERVTLYEISIPVYRRPKPNTQTGD